MRASPAEIVLDLERMARGSSPDTVATVGELALDPSVIKVIPGRARLGLDVRSVSGDHVGIADRVVRDAADRARGRAQSTAYAERQRVDPTVLDGEIVAALEQAAADAGCPPAGCTRQRPDTMMVARRVPAAMVFVPCEDGISHSPQERADPADGAVAAEVMLAAIQRLMDRTTTGRMA